MPLSQRRYEDQGRKLLMGISAAWIHEIDTDAALTELELA
jgi:hypothetical protein